MGNKTSQCDVYATCSILVAVSELRFHLIPGRQINTKVKLSSPRIKLIILTCVNLQFARKLSGSLFWD